MTAPAAEPDRHSYFMMIPFMAADDLDLFEFRLLAHYIRICFLMGECLQGARAIHQATKMSLGMITRARKSLETKGFIKVSMPDGKSRNRGEAAIVTIVDRWRRTPPGTVRGVHHMNNVVHHMNKLVHLVNRIKNIKKKNFKSKKKQLLYQQLI